MYTKSGIATRPIKCEKNTCFSQENKVINKLNLRINNNIINETDQFNFLGTTYKHTLNLGSTKNMYTYHGYHKEVAIYISYNCIAIHI